VSQARTPTPSRPRKENAARSRPALQRELVYTRLDGIRGSRALRLPLACGGASLRGFCQRLREASLALLPE
jgi:hypothetical protein